MASEAGSEHLSRLRAIAEEGRRRPLLGGRSMLVWGCAIALASMIHWAIVIGILRVSPWFLAISWFGITTSAAIIAGIAERRSEGDGAELSNANRVSRAVWQVAGSFLGLLALGLVIQATLATRAGGDGLWVLLTVMSPVTFGVYAIALAATAVSAEAAWLRRFSWLSLGFTVLTAALIGRHEQYLAMAAGALIVSAVPGLRLIRDRHG